VQSYRHSVFLFKAARNVEMRRRFPQVGIRDFGRGPATDPICGKIVHAKLHTDGYAATTCNGGYLGDPSLDSVMEELNHRGCSRP
jgi:hypothetical protein